MLRSIKSLRALMTLLIDDENWVIRYLVVDTGKWIPRTCFTSIKAVPNIGIRGCRDG
jgi:hypothetical protein